jgi:hypothetical protein
MVVIFGPQPLNRVTQERIAAPFRCTVQAPQSARAAAKLGAGQAQGVTQGPRMGWCPGH